MTQDQIKEKMKDIETKFKGNRETRDRLAKQLQELAEESFRLQGEHRLLTELLKEEQPK
jgi:hypothetical protein